MQQQEPEVVLQDAPTAEAQTDGGGPGGRSTLYSEDVIRKIKHQIKLIWEREKEFNKRTQDDLAKRLGVKQSAVSKLLNNESSHPWTVDKIETFAKFCDVPISEIVKDQALLGYFNGWTGDSIPPERARIEEAKAALKAFLDKHGRDLDEPKLYELAGKLAVRVEGTERSTDIYGREIMQLLISEV
ncbi:MAG: helix-turn-helix transcriptional regulator [Pseudomonadota bacterium]